MFTLRYRNSSLNYFAYRNKGDTLRCLNKNVYQNIIYNIKT